jgi:hypothetical protein
MYLWGYLIDNQPLFIYKKRNSAEKKTVTTSGDILDWYIKTDG